MIGFHEFQSGHLNVKFHALFDSGIARAKGFDFRERERGFVHVLTSPDGGFARQNPRNKFLLMLHGLPQIGVERGVRDVTANMNRFVPVSLPRDTSLTLG